MHKIELLNDLAKLLGMDPGILTDELPLYSLDNWDSLAMVNMLGVIDEHYKILVSIDELMKCKKVSDIFDLVQDKSLSLRSKLIPFEAAAFYHGYITSPIQERFWFLNEVASNKAIYNLPIVLRLKGRLHLWALEKSLATIVRRHAALRTIFYWESDLLLQKIIPEVAISLVVVSLMESTLSIDACINSVIAEPFNLEVSPLFRCSLFEVSEVDFTFVMVIHHSIVDFSSIGILLKELEFFYNNYIEQNSVALPLLKKEYIDYAGWQRAWMKTASFSRGLFYWKEHLAGTNSRPILSCRRSNVSDLSQSSCFHVILLETELISKIKVWCEVQNVTLFSGLLTVYAILLHGYVKKSDVLIGCPVANRHHPETQEMVGSVANLLPLRIRFEGAKTVNLLLQHVWGVITQGFLYSDVPYDEMMKQFPQENRLANFFQTMFNFLGTSIPKIELSGLSVEQIVGGRSITEFDLTVEISEIQQGLQVVFSCHESLFNQSEIISMAERYKKLLGLVAEQSCQEIDALQGLVFPSSVKKHYLHIVSNYTVEFMIPALAEGLTQLCFSPSITSGLYNQVIQELMDLKSALYDVGDGGNFLLIRLEDVGFQFEQLEAYKDLLLVGLSQYSQKAHKPLWLVLGPISSQALLKKAQREILQRLRDELERAVSSLNKITLIPETGVQLRYFIPNINDSFANEIGHIPYSENYYAALGSLLAKHYDQYFQMPPKAIIVDCDNTLWDGVIGEVGVDGIKIQPHCQAFQRELKMLSKQGVLIALCSKNNESDVLAAFQLRKNLEDGASIQKNDQEKAKWRLHHLGAFFHQPLEDMKQVLVELFAIKEIDLGVLGNEIFFHLQNGLDILLSSQKQLLKDVGLCCGENYICFEVENLKDELAALSKEGVSILCATSFNQQPAAWIDTPLGKIKLLQSKNWSKTTCAKKIAVGFYVENLFEAKKILRDKLGAHADIERFDLYGIKSCLMSGNDAYIELIETKGSSGSYYRQFVSHIELQKEQLRSLGYQQAMIEQENELILYSSFGLIKWYQSNFEKTSNASEMQLDLSDIVAYRINWQTKSQNIKALASELNIGLDSCLFIDDCEMECAEVRHACPEVKVACLPKDPESIAALLMDMGCFDRKNTLTKEDQRRTQMYQEERQRKQLKVESTSYEAFLKKLAVQVKLEIAKDSEQFSRISQLTQRTNQFNALKKIYQASEIQHYQAQESNKVLAIYVDDFFGKYGLVGCVFYQELEMALQVDQFLLSCRVLGRGVEYEILRELGRRALEKSKAQVRITFEESDRNQVIKSFLESLPGVFCQGCYVFSPERIVDLDASAYAAKMLLSSEKKKSEVNFETYAPPETETEKTLIAIWQDLLLLKNIGRKDNFFHLGGHSLLMVRCMIRIRAEFNLEVSLKEMFQWPILLELALHLDRLRQAHRESIPDIQKRPVLYAKFSPLSFSQEGLLWLLGKQSGRASVYNIPIAFKISGALDKQRLDEAFKAVIARHEILRTIFVEINGEMQQKISSESHFRLIINNCENKKEEIGKIIQSEISCLFDLSSGPLLRAILFILNEKTCILLVVFHHIIVDGWSIDIFLEELATQYYQGKSSIPLFDGSQYADYAYWQRNVLPGKVLDDQRNYWKEQLKGAPPQLIFPFDFMRQEGSVGGESTFLQLELDAQLTDTLRHLIDRQGKSMFMFLFAVFSALLYTCSSQKDMVIGTSMANRQYPGTEKLLGLLMNNVGLRVQFSEKMTFKDLLVQVTHRVQAAYDNQDVPFEYLVRDFCLPLKLNQHPLFQVMFSYRSGDLVQLMGEYFPDLVFEDISAGADIARFDLRLRVYDKPNSINLFFEYATDLFKHSTIETLAEMFIRLLRQSIETLDFLITKHSDFKG